MRVVMYHYVRPWSSRLPHLKSLHSDDFKKQIDALGNLGRFLTREEFEDCLDGAPAPNDGILLTFDDGFAEHAAFVAPYLASKGLWGQFFVTSIPYISGKMIAVHGADRIHMLLAQGAGAAALKRTQDIVNSDAFSRAHTEIERNRDGGASAYQSQNAGPDVTFKRLLNYQLSIADRDRLLDVLIPEFLGNELDYVETLYADIASLQEMKSLGMSLGGHSVSHPPLALLEEDEQRREIGENILFLQDRGLLGGKFGFAYPYGTNESFSDVTMSILQTKGCTFAYTTQPRPVTSDDPSGNAVQIASLGL